MRRIALLAIAMACVWTAQPTTAAMCPDRTPSAINAVALSSLKCQDTIAKEGGKFVKKMQKAFSKCLLKGDPNCPDAKTLEKITKAGQKAEAKIAKKCGASEIAGLSSSYSGETAAVLSSCMLSQHNAFATVLATANTGVFNEDNQLLSDDANKDMGKCTKEVSKSTTKYVDKAHKTILKCISKQIKQETGNNLVDTCVGQYSGGTFVPPTDPKTAEKLAKLEEQIEGKIDKKCGSNQSLGFIPYMYACAGAQNVDDLKECVLCGGWDVVLEMLEQQYSETGTYVAHAPGALNAAFGTFAGTASGKLLIGSGTYEESVFFADDDLDPQTPEFALNLENLSVVGCGGATNERPLLTPPAVDPLPRGFSLASSSLNYLNVTFQSLVVGPWAADGIFAANANGITFRDIIGDGGSDPEVQGSGSVYAVFPVQSNNVLVEGCRVERVHDAGIYVGQSTNIVVAHNFVEDNTAGIEIENSGNAQVYNNYATGNTGGLLIFKLPGPPLQIGGCHEIHHNFSENNNRSNNGPGTVGLIPPGTGLVVLTNDFSLFDYNVIRDNKTFGFLITDQLALNAIIDPDPFNPPSPDANLEGNFFRNNVVIDNAYDADAFAMGFENDALVLFGGPGNCQENNLTGTPGSNLSGLPLCGAPAFGSCPIPPLL